MGFVRPPPLVLFAAAILLGRVTGLLREIILANALGASRTVDILVLSLTLPDLLANVLFVSGFSVALVPHLRMLSPQHQAECFSGLLARVMPVMCLIAFVGAFFADALVHLLAPGLVPLAGRESLPIQVSILSLPFVVLSGLLVAAMMARDSFVYGGLGTAVLNSGVILGILAGAYWVDPLIAVPLGLLGGALARNTLHGFGAWRVGFRWRVARVPVPPSLFRHIMISAGAMSALTLAPVMLRAVASYLGEGRVTLFTLAVKMLELPLTAVFWSIGFLALPALSSLYQTDLVAAHSRLSRDLRLSVFLGLIASIVIGSVPEFWVSLFFSTGHFSSEQLALLAQDLAIGASAFPAMAATTILLNDAFARRQLWPVLTLILCTLMGVGSLAYLGATVFVWQKILMSAWVILYCLLAVALYVRRQRRFQSPMRLGRFEILCLCGVQGLWLGAGMFGGEEAPLLGVIVSLCLCAALALTTPYRECMRGLLQTLRRKVGAR